ncbi:MAG: hypothetical protein IH820_16675 [Bacteroidetes bacterium]|nr:hypothetical protein [Bacteroidota bacterium]
MKTDVARIRALMKKYRDQPMSLADACLVRMAELHPGSTVLTLDADFHIYRKHKQDTIPVIMPGPSRVTCISMNVGDADFFVRIHASGCLSLVTLEGSPSPSTLLDR